MKNPKEIVQEYFTSFSKKEGWENLVTDNIVFEGPMPTVSGKPKWVEMTQQFLMGITSTSLDSTISEGNKVALTATYYMALPTGDTHTLKTIVVYTIQDEKIDHILISFDTASFNEFMAKMPQEN